MRSFAGFPTGRTRFTPIPDLFYTELLPAIDDMAELKLTLFMFYSLNRQRGYPRYMTAAELHQEGVLLSALRDESDPEVNVDAVLDASIDRAVERGTLLRLVVCDHEQDEETQYLFVNTMQGRKAVQEVKDGELVLESTGYVREAHVEAKRLSIFELYEQNIGLLQPLLAEELRDASARYPHDWIVEAFAIAVERNARNWRYIHTILERWAREGKDKGRRRERY